MSLSDWEVSSWNLAVHGAPVHWSATNVKTGQRIEAESRRELMRELEKLTEEKTDV